MMPPPAVSACEGYDRIAGSFDRERKAKPWERAYFERFASGLPASALVLDCGCGSGHPGLARVLEKGCRAVGLDGSRAMLALFAERYPETPAIHCDMRRFEPDARFDGILAWDGFFHLSHPDQADMIDRFGRWLRPGGRLMFTSGPSNGTAGGAMFGIEFSYASFAEDEYRRLLADAGFGDVRSEFDEPGARIHKVWMAERAA